MWAEFICARGSFGPERSSGAWEPNRLCTSNPAQLDYEGCGGVPGGTNSVRLTTYLRAGLGLELGDETRRARRWPENSVMSQLARDLASSSSPGRPRVGQSRLQKAASRGRSAGAFECHPFSMCGRYAYKLS